jgi:hypothetical protein
MIEIICSFILGAGIVLAFYVVWLIIEDALKGPKR